MASKHVGGAGGIEAYSNNPKQIDSTADNVLSIAVEAMEAPEAPESALGLYAS